VGSGGNIEELSNTEVSEQFRDGWNPKVIENTHESKKMKLTDGFSVLAGPYVSMKSDETERDSVCRHSEVRENASEVKNRLVSNQYSEGFNTLDSLSAEVKEKGCVSVKPELQVKLFEKLNLSVPLNKDVP
jgi:hypothetical protein